MHLLARWATHEDSPCCHGATVLICVEGHLGRFIIGEPEFRAGKMVQGPTPMSWGWE